MVGKKKEKTNHLLGALVSSAALPSVLGSSCHWLLRFRSTGRHRWPAQSGRGQPGSHLCGPLLCSSCGRKPQHERHPSNPSQDLQASSTQRHDCREQLASWESHQSAEKEEKKKNKRTKEKKNKRSREPKNKWQKMKEPHRQRVLSNGLVVLSLSEQSIACGFEGQESLLLKEPKDLLRKEKEKKRKEKEKKRKEKEKEMKRKEKKRN